MFMTMKISIITVCYNSEATIENAINSVLSQDYPNIEYIVVDGKSSDKTLDVISKYKDKIAKIISEKDDGIYFALNKGIALATGDVIGVLHSDDFYPNEKIISRVATEFKMKNTDSVYGDLQYVKQNDTSKVFRHWKAGEYREGIFKKGWMPPHPTFFVKKSVYEKHGVFNTQLKLSADYELMLRFLQKNKISVSYIPDVLVKMRVGGKSNVSLSNRIKANREDRFAWKLNDMKPSLFTLLLKPVSKAVQFFKR